MSRIAVVTNIPAPYRVDLFNYIQTTVKEHELHIIYTSKNEDNRPWSIPENKLLNSHILSSRVIRLDGKTDKKYIHIPFNLRTVLYEIDPDIVIAMEYNLTALQTLWWCKKNKKKFIHLTDGTLFSERNIGKLQKVTRKIITKNCDAALASSTKAKEKLLAWGIPEEKIFLSLLTLDISPFLNIDSKTSKTN